MSADASGPLPDFASQIHSERQTYAPPRGGQRLDPKNKMEHENTVATKIKLMRLGKVRAPYYRIVVADARTKRNGRGIETIGKYHPKEDPSFIEVDTERAQYWLGVGAQPTEAVAALLKVTGDWQKFKGEPAPEPMKTKAPREDKKAKYEAALAGAMAEADASGKGAATTAKKKAPKADAAKADAPKADAPKAEAPKADEAKAATEEAPAEGAK